MVNLRGIVRTIDRAQVRFQRQAGIDGPYSDGFRDAGSGCSCTAFTPAIWR